MNIARIARAQAALKATDARSEAEKEAARKNDKATHRELKELSRLSINSTCSDCGASFPGWAALPHGIFLCIDCAQVHRRVGRHVSQVKAINTGTYLWFPDEVEVMRAIGNANSKVLLLGNEESNGAAERKSISEATTPTSKAEAKLRYVKKKYEQRLWAKGIISHAGDAQEEKSAKQNSVQPSKRQQTKISSQLARQKTPEFIDLLDVPSEISAFTSLMKVEQPIDPDIKRRKNQSEANLMQQTKDLYDTKAANIMSLYESKMFNARTYSNDRPTGAFFFAEFGV